MYSEDYEIFTKDVIQELMSAESVKVYHLKEYIGRISQRKIKTDVSFETSVLGSTILVLVECKYYKKVIDVSEVEEFHSKLDDIGAHKGIVITTIGFKDGAIKTAKGRGIALAILNPELSNKCLQYITKSYKQNDIRNNRFILFQGNFKPWGRFNDKRYEAGFQFNNAERMLNILRLSMFDEIINADTNSNKNT